MNLFSITCSANNIPFPSFLDTARTCFLSFLIFECNSRSADLIWPNWQWQNHSSTTIQLPSQPIFNHPFPFFFGSFIWLPTCWKEHVQGLSEFRISLISLFHPWPLVGRLFRRLHLRRLFRHFCQQHFGRCVHVGMPCVGDQKQHREDPYIHLIGFSIINHPFWGTPIFGNTHVYNILYIIYAYIWLKLYGKCRSIYQSDGSYGTEGIQSWKSLEIESLSCQFSHDIHTFLENNIAGSHLTQRNTILQPSYWHLLCNLWR